MAIEPDTKDWTWVLERPCLECGYDGALVAAADVASRVRATVPVYRRALADPDSAVRTRDDRWSILKYACHVRDVHRLYDYRLGLMLELDDPLFPNWDQDESSEGYAAQDPALVAEELAEAAEEIADAFDGVEPDQWRRTGRRSDGKAFTIDTFARYYLHDIEHHAWDITGDPAGSWL